MKVNASTIQHYIEEGKRLLDVALGEWGMTAVIVVVALASFGLGRLSVLEAGKPLIAISTENGANKPREMSLGGDYVASDTGSVYYFPWCGTAMNIAKEKQVWFKTEEEARDAGYRPAKNCKGM